MKKIFLLLLFFITSVQIIAQKNLISNGDFESELNSWKGNAAIITPWVVKNGKNSCSITAFNKTDWAGIDQTFYFSKKAIYLNINTWVKTDQIEQGKETWNTGLIIIEFIGNGNKKIGEGINICSLTGSQEWTNISKKIVIPDGAKSCRVMIALSYASGSLFVDDISATEQNTVEETKKEPVVKTVNPIAEFTNGDFENGTKGWGNYVGELSSDAHAGSKSYSIANTNSEWAGIEQKGLIPDNTKTIDFGAYLKSENIVIGKDSWNGGVLIIEFLNDADKALAVGENIAILTGTKNWTAYTKNISVPALAKKYRIMVALSFCTGKLFVDDVTLKFNP